MMRIGADQPQFRLIVVVCLMAVGVLATSARADDDDAFFKRFAKHVASQTDLDPGARAIISEALGEADDVDPEMLLVESLVVMSPAFLAAMDHYDEDEYLETVKALTPLRASGDPYLRHNAEAYAIRAMVAMDQLVEARASIEAVLQNREEFSAHTFAESEMAYLLGYCHVQLLEFDKGRATLEQFLRDYPDAPQRLVVTARQMLAELARRVPESIGEVADLMQFSQKRLANADTGEKVRQAQQRVIDLLDELIDEAQKREQQAQQASQSQSKKQQQKQQNQSQPQPQQQPMDQSQLDQRRANAALKKAGRVVQPGEAWGAMPEAQREKVLQVLRDSFPGRYRVLVEQYYESLAEQP